MLEPFAEALKIFFERHLIPTVISLFVAGIAILFIPNDSAMVKKITVTGVFLLIAGGCFLVVQLLIHSYELLSETRYLKKREKELEIQDEKKEMEHLWSFIDEVNPQDLKIIKKLMKSGNKPIEYEGYLFSSNSVLENDTVMVSRQISRNGKMIKQYMLRHEIYNNLMYSQQKYGRISHFQDDAEE